MPLSEPGQEIDALIEPYLDKIYSGQWDYDRVIDELYNRTSADLLAGFEKGYDKKFFGEDWTTKDNRLLNRVQNNIFSFSGAKSYSEVQELRDAVYENGKLLDKPEYRRRARKINQTYNETYLEVERELVMKSGTEGSRWLDIEDSKDTHPYLEYVTMGDDRVREEHRALHGIILPVDDPFWNYYYTPNGYRCRCTTRKRTEREYAAKSDQYRQRGMSDKLDSGESQKRAGKVVAKPFRHNVGTSEVFERSGHPYFKANKDAKDMQLSAVKNYGMKPVKDIYKNEQKLSGYRGSIKDLKDFNDLWSNLESKYGKSGDGFTITDRKNNIAAHFDEMLKQKMINRERFYFDEIEKVLTQPDEIWATIKGSKKRMFGTEMFNVYIKYYEDRPLIVLINMEGRVDSFYRLKTLEQCEQFRKGLLKKR